MASAARGSLIASPCAVAQHAQGLSEDTPSFRQRLHCKYRDACEFEEKATKVVASVESYLKAMSGFGELTECQSQRQPFLPAPDREERGRAQVSRKCCRMRWVTPLRALHTKCWGC